MRKNIFIILVFLVVSACDLYCCREKSGTKKDELEVTSSLAAPEIDVQKITKISGIPFLLIKVQTEGYMPVHRFYWVCVEEKIPLPTTASPSIFSAERTSRVLLGIPSVSPMPIFFLIEAG